MPNSVAFRVAAIALVLAGAACGSTESKADTPADDVPATTEGGEHTMPDGTTMEGDEHTGSTHTMPDGTVMEGHTHGDHDPGAH